MKKIMTRFAILILSVFTVSAGATAATLPLMMKSFPNISATTIELLMTIPSLGIIIFTPISNIVADFIGVKRTIMTGLALIFLGGVIPAITMNFPLIFASRIILGLGTGLLMSFSQSLIIQLYEGSDQQKMLGLSSVFQGLGMFVMTYSAGLLLNSGWQMSYWIYLIVLPIILLVGIYVPKTVGRIEESSQNETKTSKKVDTKIWLLAIFAFLFNATFAFISIKFALLVVSRNYGTASDASTLLGLMAFAMAAGGFIFMYVQKHWFKFTTAIGLGFAAVSFLLLSVSHSLVLSGLGVILVGISVSIFMASMIANINQMTSASQVAFSTSVVMTCANVGTLLSPYFAKSISTVFGNLEPGFTFEAGLVIFAVLFLIAIFAGINYSRLEHKETTQINDNIKAQN